MNCPHCDNAVIASYDYCPKCGGWLLPGVRPTHGAAAAMAQPPGPVQYAPPAQPAGRRDRDLAFLLEVLPGLFGLLGIGHMYGGNVVRGVSLLLGYWIFMAFEGALMFVGVGFCLLPANLVLPLLSAFWVRRELERQRPLSLAR